MPSLSMFENYYAATCAESPPAAARRERGLGVLCYAAEFESVGSGHQDRIGAVGDSVLPIHWGTFNLAFHAWDEPAERVVVAAAAAGARLVMPKPGESVEPATAPPVKPWWRAVRGK